MGGRSARGSGRLDAAPVHEVKIGPISDEIISEYGTDRFWWFVRSMREMEQRWDEHPIISRLADMTAWVLHPIVCWKSRHMWSDWYAIKAELTEVGL